MIRQEKKLLLFPEMRGDDKKNSLRRPQIYFFNRFSGDILFSSLVSFVFLYSCFSLLVCLFFEIQNVCFDTHSTMRAGEL